MEIVDVRTEVNDKGVMVVHSSKGREVYEMTKKPPPTSYLVERAMEDILDGLGLLDVLTELSRASDLLHLAHMGVAGTGDLASRIGERKRELSNLCLKCEDTMYALQEGSLGVLERLTVVYKDLLANKELSALQKLTKCAVAARKMAAKCEELALGFGKTRDDTDDDIVAVDVAVGAQVEQLKKLADDYRKNETEELATLVESDLLKSQIEKIVQDTTYLKETEELAHRRAFQAVLIGALFAPFSLVGTVARVLTNPFSLFLQQVSPPPSKGKNGLEDSGQQKSKYVTKAGVDDKILEEASNAAESARACEKEASEKQRTLTEKLLLANADRDAKQNLLEATEDADKAGAGYEEKVRRAKSELKRSSQTLATLQAEQARAEKDLEAAEEALKVAGEKMKEYTDQISQTQTDLAKESATEWRVLVQQRIAKENNRREALVHLARLTSLLKSNEEEESEAEKSRVALEIARSALSGLFVAFMEAKKFWDRMTKVCEALADPKMIKQVKRIIDRGGSDEERMRFYRSERFVTQAVTYNSQWVALTTVCGKHAEASRTAFQSALKNIRESPSFEAAREGVAPLAERLLGEIHTATRKSIEKQSRLKDDAQWAYT